MNAKKHYLFTTFLLLSSILFFSLIFPSNAYASGDLELKNLNFDVVLNSNGSANITETWDISIEDTNTLFKTFKVDSSQYSDISDVSVVETTNSKTTYFTHDFNEQYHVTKDHYYALINSNGNFEIAWGVSEDDSYARRSFVISYTVEDAIKNYQDCSEFYWQLVGSDFEIPANNVTGTIKIPYSVINLEDFRVWAHGPLNGNIIKVDDSTATFEVSNFNSNTMLEIRVVTPTSVFPTNYNLYQTSKLDTILTEEQGWADKANAQREQNAKVQILITIVSAVVFALGIIVAICYIVKIVKYHKILKETKKITPTMEFKYFRDIPDENATPAQATFVYYFDQAGIASKYSQTLSATLLDLCLKKYISFQVDINNKNKIIIILNDVHNLKTLAGSEKIVFDLLVNIANSKKSNSFTMKDFEKYTQNHVSSFQKILTNIGELAKKESTANGIYDVELAAKANSWSTKAILYMLFAILLLVFSMFLLTPLAITFFVAFGYCIAIYNKLHTLSQKGVDEAQKWKCLKKYMEDFSTMDKKEVPELVLWEKYLVYATAFGIADKVLKQLKIVYPQLADSTYMASHYSNYTFFNIMYAPNLTSGTNFNFINSLNTITSSSCNYSSGSGAGGGFSGGGGGRRRRWPVVAVVKFKKGDGSKIKFFCG